MTRILDTPWDEEDWVRDIEFDIATVTVSVSYIRCQYDWHCVSYAIYLLQQYHNGELT